MAAVQHADMKRRTGKDADQVTLTFRLSELRAQLAEDGHHFKGAEIAEALEVLALSKIQLSGDVPDNVAEGYRWKSTQAYSMLEDLRVVEPKEGDTRPTAIIPHTSCPFTRLRQPLSCKGDSSIIITAAQCSSGGLLRAG